MREITAVVLVYLRVRRRVLDYVRSTKSWDAESSQSAKDIFNMTSMSTDIVDVIYYDGKEGTH
jgi:hypothetical protein